MSTFGNLLLHIEAEVGGHLVVAAASGVQTLARLADALGEEGLDVHVDVLVVQRELHLLVLDVLQNGLQALHNLLRLVLFNDALTAQHGGVGNGATDILFIEAGVKGDGGVEVIDLCIRFLLEASCP